MAAANPTIDDDLLARLVATARPPDRCKFAAAAGDLLATFDEAATRGVGPTIIARALREQGRPSVNEKTVGVHLKRECRCFQTT